MKLRWMLSTLLLSSIIMVGVNLVSFDANYPALNPFILKLETKDSWGEGHLKDPLVSIVSNPLHHVDPEGVHQLIVGLSQNLACSLRQPQDQIVTVEETRKASSLVCFVPINNDRKTTHPVKMDNLNV